MKRIILLLLLSILLLIGAACNPSEPPTSQPPTDESIAPEPPDNPVIRLSTTTSVNDSGLLPYLQPYFEAATGYRLLITSAGTGAAIQKGRTGDADLLLVHAQAQEEAFIAEGYAVERIPFMHNFFVILGPADDPAGVAQAAKAAEALQLIAASEHVFVSRGDNSGTHSAELNIWQAGGFTPDPAIDSWYISAGAGMGASINMASELQAYLLADKGTYLAHQLRDNLEILLEKADELKNIYSMLAIVPDKWPDANYQGSRAFITWMLSDQAAQLINNYGVAEFGEPLFFFGID